MKPLIIALLFSTTISCKQNASSSAIKEKKEAIKNTTTQTAIVTDKHVKVPGSHFYIIPPAGFKADATTMQIKKDYANFMLMKMISGYTPEKYFSELKADAEKKLPGNWKQEEFAINGQKATIYQYKTSGVFQHYLHFTEVNSDEILIAGFEENDAATGKEMYAALKTVVLEK